MRGYCGPKGSRIRRGQVGERVTSSHAHEPDEMGPTARRRSEPTEFGQARDFRSRYHVVAKLGEGGMALVHLAVVRGLAGTRKLVVLKSVRPELLAEENIRNMFVEEARVATTLSHPNIVQTFEIAVSNGGPVLVME